MAANPDLTPSFTLEECLRVQLWIPPIDLPDGRRLVVHNAEVAIEPIRFLIPDPNGGVITALYHVRGNRWEIVE